MPAGLSLGIPHVVVSGNAYERGCQCGAQARDRILRSIALYRRVFAHRAGLDWPDAVRRAQAYVPRIRQFAPSCIEEMNGIADGAKVERGDIVALNARSELMFASVAGQRSAAPAMAECTSFAVMPEASANGHTLVGQNWDWLPAALETAIVLEAHREDGPSFVTIAEAGHLAKVGFNSSGIGVCTNTLVSTEDRDVDGIPYHVMLRVLLDAENMTGIARTLLGPARAFSGNYLVAHKDGLAVNAETMSGDAHNVSITMPSSGVLAHANHFVCSEFAPSDARVAQHPHSLFRHDCMLRAVRRDDAPVTVDELMAAMRSHQNHPDGICAHPDKRINPLEQRTTVASVIADLDAGELWFTPGPPCESDYRRFDYAARLNAAVS